MSLSRLQLAAALLEYDNNEEDPYRPPRSHRDSALFKPYQPRPLDDVQIHQNGSNIHHQLSTHRPQSEKSHRRLSQPLSPNRPGTLYDPGLERQSRYDQYEEHAGKAPVPDVELDRWDLPEHLVSAEPSGTQAGRPLPVRAETDHLADRRSRQLPPLRTSTAPSWPQPVSSPLADRINSVHLDVLDGIPAGEHAGLSSQGLDAYDQAQEAIVQAQRVQSMYDTSASRTPTMVPLPPSPASTLMSGRPVSSMGNEMMGGRALSGSFDGGRPVSVMSRSSLDVLRAGERMETMRPGTSISRNSYDALRSPGSGRPRSGLDINPEEEEEILAPNPFALPAPPVEMGSRFDPKVLDAQRKSMDLTRPMSRISLAVSSPDHVAYDPASLQFPSTLTEEHLTAHLTGQPLPEPDANPFVGRELNTYADIPTAQEYGRPLRPSKYGPLPPIDRRSLLRPKTIILPRPLSEIPQPESPPKNVPEGYILGDKPLPPGSRSSILTTEMRSRPGLPLSLSQKTFRSSLMVGGRREDDSYWVGGATEDGEVGVEFAGEPDELGPMDRRPGKLYGKSLMDQLEARKTAMKAKQRVFTGDSRPAMMARADQPDRPQSMVAPPGHRQPLLHLDDSGQPGADDLRVQGDPPARPTDRMTKSQSVFGVDKIWEREMAKLKIIQEREAKIAAEQAAKEELAARKKEEKEAKKNRKKKRQVDSPVVDAMEDDGLLAGQEPENGVSPIARMADLPPQLSYSPERAVKPVAATEVAAEDPADDLEDDQSIRSEPAEGKLAESGSEADSEEDVPLSRFARAKSTSTQGAQVESDSDSEEDVPLSKLRSPVKTSPTAPLTMIPANYGTGSLGLDVRPRNDDDDYEDDNDEEEDDVPLALRKNAPAGVEDDLPLGYKHAEAAQRQQAESWRASMASPQMGNASGTGVPHMGHPWGYAHPQVNAMMSPYASAYGVPNMGMGYLSPAMTGMSGMGHVAGMGQMGWPGQMLPGMPVPGMTLTMPGMGAPMMGPDGGPMPPQATKNIDDWRKEVAIQPVPTGSSSTRG